MSLPHPAPAARARAVVLLALVAVPIGARAARAGVTAHLACAADGGKPLASRAKIKVDKLVACTIIVDKGAVPAGATATITAASVTPAGGVPVTKTADPVTTARADHKVAFAPIASFAAGTDFMACSALRFDGVITSGTTVVWKGAVETRAACTDIKPRTGALTCIGLVHGAPLDYPGDGVKQKPSLDEAGLTCTIKVKGTGDAPAFGVFNVASSTKPPLARSIANDDKFPEPRAFVQLTAPLLPACKPFVVQGAVLRQDGALLWSGTLAIPQVCKK
jgi:hypothetical protein